MGLIGISALPGIFLPSKITAYRAEASQEIEKPKEVVSEPPKKETNKLAINTIIGQYDWDADIAYGIMFCESSGNPNAHNFSNITKDNSWGLFQINLYSDLAKVRPSPEWLKIPENNVSYAYGLYKKSGWTPWKNCY